MKKITDWSFVFAVGVTKEQKKKILREFNSFMYDTASFLENKNLMFSIKGKMPNSDPPRGTNVRHDEYIIEVERITKKNIFQDVNMHHEYSVLSTSGEEFVILQCEISKELEEEINKAIEQLPNKAPV